jgi:hypothetical protein
VEQVEEGTHEAPTVETAPTDPLLVLASVSTVGQMEAGASEMSAENVAVGQASAPVLPTLATTGQTIPEEALL